MNGEVKWNDHQEPIAAIELIIMQLHGTTVCKLFVNLIQIELFRHKLKMNGEICVLLIWCHPLLLKANQVQTNISS